MDMQTTYLGLSLKNPLVPSASPLSRDLDTAKRLEDAGASALVMYSLFEEEVEEDDRQFDQLLNQEIGHGEASSYLPPDYSQACHVDEYLAQLMDLKRSLEIPVIASLNGNTLGGWVEHAMEIQQSGADAIELNVYHVPADISESGEQVEERYVDLLTELRSRLSLPITVKLSSQFSSPGNMVYRLQQAGANGVVLFNRFYQPDIDLENLSMKHTLHFSDSADSLLAMRWIAILYGKVDLSLAATSGVHTAEDALKLMLAGADVCHMTAALLRHGPQHIDRMLDGMSEWLEEHEYDSLQQLKGSMSFEHAANPVDFVRANYIRLLQGYHG